MTCVLKLACPPPSVNAMYRNVPGVGRVKSKGYKAWQLAALWDVRIQRAPTYAGIVAVEIQLPRDTRGDVDNRAKAILDLLEKTGVVANDRQCDPVRIGRADVEQTTIIITEADDERSA